MAQINILKEETLSDKEFLLKLYEFEKEGSDGKQTAQKNEIYYRPDGVTALLVDEEEQVFLFTRQVRLATYLNGNGSGYLVETCAGGLEDNESPEEAIIREVREETGYEISGLKKVMQGYPSPGGNTEIIYFFIAAYDSKGSHGEGGGVEGEGEDIDLVTMKIAEAKEKLLSGWFIDVKTILLLQHYFLSKG